MLAFVVICIIMGGVFGDEKCRYSNVYGNCYHHIPFEEMKAIEGVPNEEELIRVCPGELEFYKCSSEAAKNCLKDEEYITNFDNLEPTYRAVKDLCNENTSLHKNYVANVECYKTLRPEGQRCMFSAIMNDYKYTHFLVKEHPERLVYWNDLGQANRQQMCMRQSYFMACIYETVEKTCGDIAASIMLEMVNKSQDLRGYCSSVMVEEVKTTFLQSLDLRSNERDIYEKAFNFMKK